MGFQKWQHSIQQVKKLRERLISSVKIKSETYDLIIFIVAYSIPKCQKYFRYITLDSKAFNNSVNETKIHVLIIWIKLKNWPCCQRLHTEFMVTAGSGYAYMWLVWEYRKICSEWILMDFNGLTHFWTSIMYIQARMHWYATIYTSLNFLIWISIKKKGRKLSAVGETSLWKCICSQKCERENVHGDWKFAD